MNTIAKVVLLTACLLATSGCGLLASELMKEFDILPKEDVGPNLSQDRLEVFNDLLKQGWKINVYNQKIILIKETPDGVIVNDVFSILKE